MNELERGYRRLLAFYPRSFRKENGDEIISVLLATSSQGQARPGLAESADLLKGAARMHMGLSRAPRSVVVAVRLMCLGALGELATMITTLATAGSIRAAAAHRYPEYAASVIRVVNFDIRLDMATLPLMMLAWLWVAWGNGRGSQWARLAAICFAALYTLAMGMNLSQGVAVLAPAAMIASAVTWAIGVAAIAFIFARRSWPYYEAKPPVSQSPTTVA
jgi:hypothetical protein